MSLDDLNRKFAINSVLQFVMGQGDLPVVEVENQFCSARISLQGAHLTSWIPKGEIEVIWLSSDASFQPGKSIRGGIPVCWPWFGAHQSEADFPAHGHARTVLWDVIDTAQEDQATRIKFKLIDNEWSRQLWPYDTELTMTLRLGKNLAITLETHNLSEQAISISQALHSYFNVADVRHIQLKGLAGCDYLDKLDAFASKRQQGEVTITGETDRIYLDTPAHYMIVDPGLQRKIEITTQGSHSTVVWNPWQETADKMADLGEQGFLRMICVETANAAEDTVQIKPGETYTLSAEYRVISDPNGA